MKDGTGVEFDAGYEHFFTEDPVLKQSCPVEECTLKEVGCEDDLAAGSKVSIG